MSLLRRQLFWWLALLCTGRLWAHDPGLSTAQATLQGKEIEVIVAFAPADVKVLLPAAARLGASWQKADFEKIRAALEEIAPQLLRFTANGIVVTPTSTKVALAAADSVNFIFRFPTPPAGPVEFRSPKLAAMVLPAGHREYFAVADAAGNVLSQKLLSASEPALALTLPSAGSAAAATGEKSTNEPVVTPTFWGFLKLGVEHIWTGYDHLLFLFGLLVVCRTFKSIVAIISCFTLAHSITLALATLNVVNLPSRFVEPAIAASIVFVGVENLVRRGAEPKGRWALTFFFGLIHGFGFASVLRELGVGQNGTGLAMPLFTFNLGVEMGQVAVAAIVLPIVWQLRKNETFLRRGVPALSAIVALAGAYWFLERTVFG